MPTSIDILAFDVMDQANKLFPERTPQSMFLKMYEEMGELAKADDPIKRADEMADVMIMLLDYAASNGIMLEVSIRRKMAINQNRKWVATKMGVNQHVD